MNPCALELETLDLAGQTIRAARYSADRKVQKSRSPILFFNGMGCSVNALEAFAQCLPGYDIISFDVPGVGGSPLPIVPYRYGNMTAVGSAVLEHFDIETAHITGLSWGSALAQQFVRDYPEKCERLILMAATIGTAMSVPDPADMLASLDGVFLFTEAGAVPTLGQLYQIGAIAGWSSAGWLHTLSLPVLVMASREDSIVPADSVEMVASMIPGAQFHCVEGEHMVFLHAPSEAAARIAKFLEESGN